MKYLRNESTDPHFNMAFDEYCLQQFQLEEPVFYLWRNSPSVIIGMNQNAYSQVNLPFIESHGIKLARRVTGGGAVYHDLQNLNYTIVGKSGDLENDYPGYLTYMTDALRQLGVNASLTGRNDIFVDGAKVSGYAKRVYKDRLMVHGTLMYDVDIDTLVHALSIPGSKIDAQGIESVRSRVANLKDFLPDIPDIQALQKALHGILADGSSEIVLDPEAMEQIAGLSREKFSLWEWNYGKSPQASFTKSRKFPCGTVEAMFSICHGQIESVSFGGDFLGNLPPEDVTVALTGARLNAEGLEDALKDLDLNSYFDGMEANDLISLILL